MINITWAVGLTSIFTALVVLCHRRSQANVVSPVKNTCCRQVSSPVQRRLLVEHDELCVRTCQLYRVNNHCCAADNTVMQSSVFTAFVVLLTSPDVSDVIWLVASTGSRPQFGCGCTPGKFINSVDRCHATNMNHELNAPTTPCRTQHLVSCSVSSLAVRLVIMTKVCCVSRQQALILHFVSSAAHAVSIKCPVHHQFNST